MGKFIMEKSKTHEGIGIQLENWSDSFPSSPQLWFSIGAYPIAKHSSGRYFGPNKWEMFRLTINFSSEAEARVAFRKLQDGETKILDYRKRFWNLENDAQFLED